jgi:hypothetical protein
MSSLNNNTSNNSNITINSNINSNSNNSNSNTSNFSSFGPFSPKNRKFTSGKEETKQEVVSITYEEIGLFPRSFSRVLDRFLKQIFSDVENLVIQEYRFYRYLFLTTLKCVLILVFVPLFVNLIAKTYVVRPLTEYFWNTKQTEIFLNSYQQKRAFSELKEFEEKTYFESLVFPKSVFKPNLHLSPATFAFEKAKGTSSEIAGQLKTESKEDLQSVLSFTSCTGCSPSDVLHAPSYKDGTTSASTTTRSLSNDRSENPLTRVQPPISVEASMEVCNFCLAPKGAKSKSLENNLETLVKDETLLQKNEKAFIENADLCLCTSTSKLDDYKQTEFLINSYTMKSSLFVYQTQEADKTIQQRYQEKTIELAQRYNDQSIEAITNFFADLMSLFTLFYLLYVLEIQINITKSFLLEVFFGLDDSKKSLLILLITDLLVGYHSSNLWELFFEFLFHHYGLPESQTGIFLLVATLPVLLDVLFKYLIFRHLNRSSPATVATYHAMIE